MTLDKGGPGGIGFILRIPRIIRGLPGLTTPDEARNRRYESSLERISHSNCVIALICSIAHVRASRAK